jgi:hypothetical protein
VARLSEPRVPANHASATRPDPFMPGNERTTESGPGKTAVPELTKDPHRFMVRVAGASGYHITVGPRSPRYSDRAYGNLNAFGLYERVPFERWLCLLEPGKERGRKRPAAILTGRDHVRILGKRADLHAVHDELDPDLDEFERESRQVGDPQHALKGSGIVAVAREVA